MSVTPARRAALQTLRAVRRGRLADVALDEAIGELDRRDRAWTQELVYGTLRLRGRLDHRLAARVHGGLDALEPDVLDILRLTAYQLTEMGGVPDYAAVSQAVDLAREASGRPAAGLVNGVLRGLASVEVAFPSFDTDPLAHLSTWGSHPAWLLERWIARWGATVVRHVVEVNNSRPEPVLRPIRLAAGAARSALARAGIEAAVRSEKPPALSLAPGVDPAEALGVIDGVMQDPAAGLVLEYADLPAAARVADLCAAPGGKAIVLGARAATAGGFVAAADRSIRRLRRLRENMDRVHDLPVALLVADARRPAIAAIDGALLDVPCTGTGTLGRHADARWRVRPADLASLVALQREILDGAAAAVRPGGLLVYATCSLEAEENEQQVEAFLQRHQDFRRESDADGDGRNSSGDLFLLPDEQRHDGAFAARLRRH